MRVFLERKNIKLSAPTVHKYMNKELKLYSVVRRKKPNYEKGTSHKIFDNLINRVFSAEKINQKWCTDFTYLFLTDGSKRYNCSILDLYDRSIIASITDKNITSDLAIRTLKKALESQPKIEGKLILHSDQGSQYTSKEFIDFCCKNNIKQSMSRAGCPYDNAVIERFYNTFKNEFFNLYSFNDYEVLDKKTYEFIYIKYNYLRPHSFNNGIPPALSKWSA